MSILSGRSSECNVASQGVDGRGAVELRGVHEAVEPNHVLGGLMVSIRAGRIAMLASEDQLVRRPLRGESDGPLGMD